MKKYFEMMFNKSKNEFYSQIEKHLLEERKTFIITANPEIFMVSTKKEEVSELLSGRDNIIVADGISIVKCAKYFGINIPERITGIDLSYKLLEYANKYGKKVYLYGGQKDVIIKMKNIIEVKYPKLKLVGTDDGYTRDREDVFKSIHKAEPDIVLVALGVPEQEILIHRNIGKFKKGIFVGVGGSFDVISGVKKRASQLFIKLNLEWLYRLIKEPKRIKRFWNNNIKFMLVVRKERKY